jgi:hypothetical protein
MLKGLIEEERNDEFIEELEVNAQRRDQDFEQLLHEIKRVAAEVRDAKRFNVYKQLHDS